MAANGYNYSRSTDRGASIAAALIAYGQHGGALFAAYRSPDNPLAPSHVRWQSASGEVIEAQHGSDGVFDLPQEEREAWAQIALSSTTNQADAVGPDAPWMPVRMERERAFELGMRAQRARLASQPPLSPQRMSSAPPSGSGGYGGYGGSAPQGAPLSSMLPRSSAPYPVYPPQLPSHQVDEYSPTRLIDALPASAPSMPEPPQNTGQWAREELLRGGAGYGGAQGHAEITVVPCVEVEMPALLTSDEQDFTRDFARDVALHFGRAARTIQQTRELRGWMRGARIVLAARMSFGAGTRPANRAEMEHAAGLLSDALARRTLPYAQLRFADFAEWNQGMELPE